jgi:predicted HTH transcriptional regulator
LDFCIRKVADVFREAGIIEKYGSGIQRITNVFYRLPLTVYRLPSIVYR